MSDNDKYFDANEALWDEKTRHHEKSDFYDVDGFLEGQSSLREIELEFLQNIEGKSVLHLQCHFGLDSLSMARMGAKVTGVDISGAAIKLARELNDKADLDAEFVLCNVYDTLDHVDQKYDYVFCSYGALVWLPDLEKWTNIVDQLLKPGGKCLICEFHPFLYTFDFPKTDIRFNYRNPGNPYTEYSAESYTDQSTHKSMKEYFWNHSLEEVMQGFITRNYQFLAFREYYYSPYDCFGNSEEVEKGKWVFGGFGIEIPHVYSLFIEKSHN